MADTKDVPDTQARHMYRYVGNHAIELWNDDGTLPWIAPGEVVNLSDVDVTSERNQYYIDNGYFIPVP